MGKMLLMVREQCAESWYLRCRKLNEEKDLAEETGSVLAVREGRYISPQLQLIPVCRIPPGV